MNDRVSNDNAAIYLVGAGIASLAAAAFLIRDRDIPGTHITILEESAKVGGSLDAAGTSAGGYTMRGGRMIESKYLCTFDLFSSIPNPRHTKTVTKEIFDWNETMKTSSKSRLFRNGHRIDAPAFGLSEKDILTIERLELEPEGCWDGPVLRTSSARLSLNRLLVHVVYDFCFSTLAQRSRIQALSGPLHSHGVRI